MTASFVEMPADWGRPEWLEWRRLGCGGSDVAAICGLSTFGSPTSVYYDKVGLAPEQPESESMQWGRLLEAPIATEFAERTGLHVVCPQVLVADDEHPWRRATLDGLVTEGDHDEFVGLRNTYEANEIALGTIEIKTTRDGVYDEIPDRAALQCCWQLGIAELEHGWLAVLHGGQRLEIYEIEFDELVYRQLCTIVDRFWRDHVLAENPPPADSNPATTAALKAVYGERATDDQIELDAFTTARAIDWLRAKVALAEAKAWVEGCENDLRAALGDASFGVVDGDEWVTWKAQKKGQHVDAKALRDEYPEIYEKFVSPPGVTRVLRAAKALKAVEVDA